MSDNSFLCMWQRIYVGLTPFRWACCVAWYSAFIAMWTGHNGGDTKIVLLTFSAALGALCTVLLIMALLMFLRAILKAVNAKHKW